MQANTYFSLPQQWDAQDLADAVPLRLHAMIDFHALRDADGIAAANSARPARRRPHAPYAAPLAFNPVFSIR